jgi:hypothetical protein
MKKSSLFAIGIVACLAFGIANAANDWQNIGTTPFSSQGARYTDTVVTSTGDIYTIFMDEAGGKYDATVKKFSQGIWSIVDKVDFSNTRN